MTRLEHKLVGQIMSDDPEIIRELQPKLDAFLNALPPTAAEWRRKGGAEWSSIIIDLGFILGSRTQFTIRTRRGRPRVDEATKAASVARSRAAARDSMRAKRAATKPKNIYLEPVVARALDSLMIDHPGMNQSQVISLLIMDASAERNRLTRPHKVDEKVERHS